MRLVKRILLWVMGAFYVVGGVNHFLNAEFYLAIMPPYLPWHWALVWISGVAEVALGIAVLIPGLRVVAAWGVIALLVAIFPANLHVAINDVGGLGVASWVRLPFQAVFIAWAWWYTRPDSSAPARATA